MRTAWKETLAQTGDQPSTDHGRPSFDRLEGSMAKSSKKTAAQLNREIADALANKSALIEKQKRYRLTIAGPTGRYIETHFTATEDEALAQARRELQQGAVYVRVDTDVDLLWGTSTRVAELRK